MNNLDVQTKNFTEDTVVCRGPCWLHFAQFVPSASGGSVIIRHGLNTSGEIIVTLLAQSWAEKIFHPALPVYCPQGLFVDSVATMSGVTVQWETAS